ncbi:MAG: GNAT family N-acetyltransferase [Spirochaetota bacterium]
MTEARIHIRDLRDDDAGPVFEAIRESIDDVSPWLAALHADITLDDIRTDIAGQPKLREVRDAFNFAIVDEADRIVGGCRLTSINWHHRFCNLYYWIRSSATGRGAAVAAVRLIAGYGFEELGLHRIEIVVDVDNARSQRVAKKVGARREGIARNRLSSNDQPREACMYSLIPGEVG